MHIADFSVGMLGANGVVAAGLPIAVGAAHALKLRGAPNVVACFFGDGAINRGPFLEALNWAATFALPVLFVCEDNRWSATTASASTTAGEGAAARAAAIGVGGVTVDGNDVEAVCDSAERLLLEIRTGAGPKLLHALTYRHKGHVSVDPARYRDPAEVSAALEADPIGQACRRLLTRGVGQHTLDALQAQATQEIAQALQAAREAPLPEPAAALLDVQDTGAGRWF
jgi:pyruvate dehydrogenase E1 component alpha subunit